MSAVSPLVVTEFGTGFLSDGELRMPFGIHSSPSPSNVRPATENEARAFFRHRAWVRETLVDFYDQADRNGHSTGD